MGLPRIFLELELEVLKKIVNVSHTDYCKELHSQCDTILNNCVFPVHVIV